MRTGGGGREGEHALRIVVAEDCHVDNRGGRVNRLVGFSHFCECHLEHFIQLWFSIREDRECDSGCIGPYREEESAVTEAYSGCAQRVICSVRWENQPQTWAAVPSKHHKHWPPQSTCKHVLTCTQLCPRHSYALTHHMPLTYHLLLQRSLLSD